MIVVSYDVLALPGPETGSRQPSAHGLSLFSLFNNREFSDICILGGNDLGPLAETWLVRTGLAKAAFHTGNLDSIGGVLTRLERNFGKIDWYLDTAADRITRVLELGFPALWVGIPDVVHWGMLPIQKKTWQETVAEVIDDKLQAA